MITKRKSKASEKIKVAAHNLFWKHGIRRITVEEICEKAAVSKMTFYRQYDHKVDLAMAVLDDVMESSLQEFHHIMNSSAPFPEKIQQVIELKQRGVKHMSQEFLMDVYQMEEPRLRHFMDEKNKMGIETILHVIAKAQKQGHIRKDLQPDFIMQLLNKINEMALDTSLLAHYASPQDLIMELTRFFFYGIANTDNPEK